MIKLIVTDMDGTFLNSKKEMHKDTFEILDRLKSKNIKFGVASGRQYFNIHSRFNNRNDILYIAENGSYIVDNGQLINFDELKKDKIKDIYYDVKSVKNSSMALCGKKGAYIEHMEDEIILDNYKEYYKELFMVDNLLDVDDEICKIAILNLDGTEKNLYPLLSKYNDTYNVSVSGFEWLDIYNKISSKGNAIKLIREKYNLKKDEIMAFGDFLNDYTLLSEVEHSYAMANAHPEIKKISKYMTSSNDEFGVIEIINKYF